MLKFFSLFCATFSLTESLRMSDEESYILAHLKNILHYPPPNSISIQTTYFAEGRFSLIALHSIEFQLLMYQLALSYKSWSSCIEIVKLKPMSSSIYLLIYILWSPNFCSIVIFPKNGTRGYPQCKYYLNSHLNFRSQLSIQGWLSNTIKIMSSSLAGNKMNLSRFVSNQYCSAKNNSL